MHSKIIVATFLAGLSSATAAEGTDALRQALTSLPASVLMSERPDQAYFLSVEAVSALPEATGKDVPMHKLIRLALGDNMLPARSLALSDPAEWEARAGTSIDAVRSFTAFGQPPGHALQWAFRTEADAAGLMDTLLTLGFEPMPQAGVLGNGEPLRLNPAQRDPANPWRTSIGAAQFAAARGEIVVQAQTPEAASALATSGPSAEENPILLTALAGMDAAAADGLVLQAMVISPLFGLIGADPGDLLVTSGGDWAAMKAAIEARIAASAEGVPPYFGGIIADLQHEHPAFVASLAYPDCTIAESAATTLAERWNSPAGERVPGTITTAVAEGVDGLCAATITVVRDTDSVETNMAYTFMIENFLRGMPTLLQISSQ